VLVDSFKVYLTITIARLITYILHLGFEKILPHILHYEDHIMSDHVVLGASLVAILEIEIYLVIRDVCLAEERLSLYLLTIALVIGLGLFGLICGDMYYTAAYFHPIAQTVIGSFVGFSFQFEAWKWLSLKSFY